MNYHDAVRIQLELGKWRLNEIRASEAHDTLGYDGTSNLTNIPHFLCTSQRKLSLMTR